MKINAFSERLCEHCELLRAGPKALEMYDDYTYSAVGVRHEDHLIIKGLVVKPRWWSLGERIRLFRYMTAINAVAKKMNLKPDWERARRMK